jgi:hypothetical protein
MLSEPSGFFYVIIGLVLFPEPSHYERANAAEHYLLS